MSGSLWRASLALDKKYRSGVEGGNFGISKRQLYASIDPDASLTTDGLQTFFRVALVCICDKYNGGRPRPQYSLAA